MPVFFARSILLTVVRWAARTSRKESKSSFLIQSSKVSTARVAVESSSLFKGSGVFKGFVANLGCFFDFFALCCMHFLKANSAS